MRWENNREGNLELIIEDEDWNKLGENWKTAKIIIGVCSCMIATAITILWFFGMCWVWSEVNSANPVPVTKGVTGVGIVDIWVVIAVVLMFCIGIFFIVLYFCSPLLVFISSWLLAIFFIYFSVYVYLTAKFVLFSSKPPKGTQCENIEESFLK
jgi:hypothetical protein